MKLKNILTTKNVFCKSIYFLKFYLYNNIYFFKNFFLLFISMKWHGFSFRMNEFFFSFSNFQNLELLFDFLRKYFLHDVEFLFTELSFNSFLYSILDIWYFLYIDLYQKFGNDDFDEFFYVLSSTVTIIHY